MSSSPGSRSRDHNDGHSLPTALAWAAALDSDEFDRLPAMLTSSCSYRTPHGVIRGAEEIVASYRSNSHWAHETFDSIEWDSECRLEPGGTVLITFIDTTDHLGEHHVYRCQQRLWFDETSLIVRIDHLPIAEEERKLAEFLDRVGISSAKPKRSESPPETR